MRISRALLAAVLGFLAAASSADEPLAPMLREYLKPMAAGTIDALTCPPYDGTYTPFDCTGTFTVGAKFHVRIVPSAQQWGVESITYDPDPRLPLVRETQEYLRSFAPPLKSLECPATQIAQGVACTAHLQTGSVTIVRVVAARDGTFAVQPSSIPLPAWMPPLSIPLLIAGSVVFLAGFVLLFVFASASEVTSLPLAEVQPIPLDRAGSYSISGNGPFLSSAWRRMVFALQQADGAVVALHPAFRARRTLYLREPLFRFTAPAAGTYFLRVAANDAAMDFSQFRLIISRPWFGRGALSVLCMIVGGMMVLAGAIIRTSS